MPRGHGEFDPKPDASGLSAAAPVDKPRNGVAMASFGGG